MVAIPVEREIEDAPGRLACWCHGIAQRKDRGRLLLGRTNIFCVQAPCPWRGIVRPTDLRSGATAMLWSDVRMPQLEASAEDAARLATAWGGAECLAIDGSLTGDTLRVDRIVGACPSCAAFPCWSCLAA